MQTNNPNFASGASAARYKLANALAEIGILIPSRGGPPLDDEFKVGVLSWRYGGKPILGNLVDAFHWFQVVYEVTVPIAIVVGVGLTRRIETHPLFSATHDRGVKHDFVLGLNEIDEIVVIKDPGDYQAEIEAQIRLSDPRP